MTEKYTPEKVAELVADARFVVERHGMTQSTILIDRLADALEAVTAERDAYKRAKAENDERLMIERDEARADRDRLHKAITEALDSLDENEDPDVVTIGILRAALDKEGNDDE